VTESGSPVSRFLITVLVQYLREIRGSIPSTSHHANRGATLSGWWDRIRSSFRNMWWQIFPGYNWRAADESHCQFQSHCGWIELRVRHRAENNLSGPNRTGPAKDHERGREGLHPTGAPHGHVRASRRIQPGLQDRYPYAPKGDRPWCTRLRRVDRNWSFIFYALRPGFVRLFAEVQIEGRSRFAPFGLRIAPWTTG